MRRRILMVVLAMMLPFMNGCATTGSTNDNLLPRDELKELIIAKEQAAADGRALKDRAGRSRQGVAREKYDKVRNAHNAALSLIQTSVAVGDSPASYATQLRSMVARVKDDGRALQEYKNTVLASRGPAETASEVSAAVDIALGSLTKIWDAASERETIAVKRQREQIRAELEQQKLKSFDDL